MCVWYVFFGGLWVGSLCIISVVASQFHVVFSLRWFHAQGLSIQFFSLFDCRVRGRCHFNCMQLT